MTFGETKVVVVTASNTHLFRVGEVTNIRICEGNHFIWCPRHMMYEDLEWAVDFWGLKFQEIDEKGVDTGI